MPKYRAQVLLGALLLTGVAVADDADAKLAEINAMKPPAADPSQAKDASYVARYKQSLIDWSTQRGKLILAFVDAYPDNAHSPELLGKYWSSLKGFDNPVPNDRIESAVREIGAYIAKKPAFAPLGKYYIAVYRDMEAGSDAAKMTSIANEFTGAYPKDPNGLNLLRIAAEATKDNAQKAALYQRMVDNYPDSPYNAMFKGTVRRLQAIGKPFDISFTDAVSGKKIDSASLKGKVVLVDFWATWCGPCIAKMPELKQLYADYKGKGFEIVGVSLDQSADKGGLQALKDYVAQNGIGWPQYYQGDAWNGAYSAGWGIMEIPTTFLVDKKGILRSVSIGEGLEPQVQALLKE